MLNAEEVYELIGLNEIERKIYETIVGLGAKTLEELVHYTGDPLPEIQSNLIALEQKGLIRRIPGKVDILVAMEPRIVLSEKVEEDLTQRLSNVRDEITTKWNEVKNALSSQLQGFKESTSAVINEHLEEFKKNVDVTKEQIDSISKDFGEHVKSDADQNRDTITITLKDNYAAFEETLTGLKDTLFDALDNTSNEFEVEMQTLNEQLAEAIREQINDWRANVTRYQEKSEQLLESTEETDAEDVEKFKKDASETLTNLTQVYTTGFTDAKEKTEGITISSIDAFKEKLNALLSNISNTFNEQLQNIDTKLMTFKDESSGMLKISLAEVKAVIEDLKKKNMEIINKTKEGISSFAEIIKTKIEDAGNTVTSLDQGLKTQIEAFNKQVDTFVDTEKDDIVAKMNQLKEEISENLTKMLTEISSLKSDFDGLLKSHASNVETMQKELLDEVSQTIKDAKSKVNELVGQSMEQLLEEFFEGSTRLQEKFSTLAYELSDIVNNSIVSTNVLIENSVNDATRLTEENQEKITTEIKANIELISQTLEESEKKDADLLTKTTDQLKEAISQVKDANQTIVKEIDEALSEMITKANTTIDTTKEQIKEQFNIEHGKLKESNEKTQTDLLEMFSVSNKNMDKQFTDLKEKTAVHIEETSQNVLKQLEESKKQNMELMKTFIDNVLTESMGIRDDVPNVIEKELEEHKDRISQLDIRFADTSGRLLSIVEVLKTKTEEKASSLFGLRKAGLEEFMDQLASMEGELQSLRAQVRDVINTNTEAYEVGVSSLLDNISRNMTYRVETIEKDAESNFEKMNTTYETIVSNFASNFQGAFQKEIENALERFINDLKTNNSEAKESVVLRLEENKEAINEMTYTAGKVLTEKLNEAKTAFEEIQKTAAINTKSLEKAGKQIDLQLQSNMNERKELMTSLCDTLTKILENQRDANQESSSSWVEQFNESFSQYEEKIVSTLIQHKMNTTTRTIEEITAQDSLLNTIKTDVESLANSLKEINESNLNSLQENTNTILNEKGAEIERNNSALQEKAEDEINTRKTETEQSVETLIEKITEEKIGASTSHLMELKQNLSDIVLNVLEETIQKVSGFNSTLNTKLSETEDMLNKLSGTLDESASTLAKLDSNIIQKFEPQAKALLEKLEKTTEGATELKEVTTELDKLSVSVNEKVKEADSEISAIKKTIFDVLEEKEGIITQDIEIILTKFDEILDQANTSVKQKVGELKSALVTSGKDYLAKFDTRLEQIITRLDQLLSRPSTTILEGTVDFKGSFSNLLSVQTTKYRENIYSSIDKINEFLENLGIEVETATKQLNEKLSETTSSQIQNYKGTVVTHKDELLQIVTSRVEGIEKELTDVVNVIPSELEAAVAASNKAARVLGTIQKLSRKAEPLPIEQTYRVVGDANILFNIKAIIDRTKANLVLITPKFEDVPVDSLSTIKKTIRVTCVTELAEANMKDAGQLQERGNVRFRNYPDPKIYVISRDSEEVLIAPAVKGRDLIGILSTNDHLIELINSELLSGYTAKSKAI